MKKIKLTRNRIALVDDEMFNELNVFKWQVNGGGYVVRKKGSIRMHILVNKTPKGFLTDHINGNKLDNRKANLRTVTQKENAMNRSKRSDNLTSIFKGVSWDRVNGKWIVLVSKKYYGRYEDEIEAAKTYNKIASRLFGAYAKLNKV